MAMSEMKTGPMLSFVRCGILAMSIDRLILLVFFDQVSKEGLKVVKRTRCQFILASNRVGLFGVATKSRRYTLFKI